MRNLIILLAICMAVMSCAANMPSKYDNGDYDDCLLYQIAQKHNVRIEDMGNIIRLAGIAGRETGEIDPAKAAEAYGKIRTALLFPITGEAFVDEVARLSVDYQEALTIILSYAPDLRVPETLDSKTVNILIDFCTARKIFYDKLAAAG